MSDDDEKELKLVKEKKNWIQLTSEDLNFDINEALQDAKDKPIKTKNQLDDRLKLLAVTIKKFTENQKVLRRTVYQYFVMIREAAEKMGYSGPQIRNIATEIFRDFGISEGHIRRVIPHELKHHEHTNIRYRKREQDTEQIEREYLDEEKALPTNLQSEEEIEETKPRMLIENIDELPDDVQIQLKNALSYIKQLEDKIKKLEEQLENSIIIGQETRVYSGYVPLDNENQLPVRVAINLRENQMEYIEIDTESMRKAAEETIES